MALGLLLCVLTAGVASSDEAANSALLVSLDLGPSGYRPGIRLSGERMYPVLAPSPAFRVEVGPRLAFAYHLLNADRGYRGSVLMVDITSSARARYALNDRLGLYGDYGWGLANTQFKYPSFSPADNSVTFTVQVGAGAFYSLASTLRIRAEVRLILYPKTGSNFFVAPGVGLEF